MSTITLNNYDSLTVEDMERLEKINRRQRAIMPVRRSQAAIRGSRHTPASRRASRRTSARSVGIHRRRSRPQLDITDFQLNQWSLCQ
ncbi:MAG: hypothetical protein ABGX16_10825 [Pirellulales bacterium]